MKIISFSFTYVTLSALTLLCISLSAQHPAWENYNTNNGLPSNEVYGLAQDANGFLWIGTQLGLCRFNGYTFNRPVDTSTNAIGSAFHPIADNSGRLWFNRLDRSLWTVEKDTVSPWQYNHLISGHAPPPLDFHYTLAEDGAVWVSLYGFGLLEVKPDGRRQIVQASRRPTTIICRTGQSVTLSTDTYHNKQEFLNQYPNLQKNLKTNCSDEVVIWENGNMTSLGRFPFHSQNGIGGFKIWALSNGDIVMHQNQDYYFIRDKRLIWHGLKNANAVKLLEDPNGAILLASNAGAHTGLLHYRTLEDFFKDEFTNLLPGHELTDIIRDREGGWWVSSLDAGIFYCANPGLEIYDAGTGLPGSDALHITSDGLENIYLGLRNGKIGILGLKDRSMRFISGPFKTTQPHFSALFFDTIYQRLWASSYLFFLEKGHWKQGSCVNCVNTLDNTNAKRLSFAPDGRHIWASSTSGFYHIDRSNGAAKLYPENIIPRERTFSVVEDLEGTIWIALSKGLQIWRNGRYEAAPISHPALRFPVRNMVVIPAQMGGGLVFALRGAGLLFRDQNGRFTHLTTEQGLSSNMLLELKVYSSGSLLACSNTGLNIVRYLPTIGWQVETLTTKHGLPSNQVNDAMILRNELWIATDRGVVRVKEGSSPANIPTPMLELFNVNNRRITYSHGLTLDHLHNNISIKFFSPYFRSKGDILYRYRLFNADTGYVYTRLREVNLFNLAPGRYQFEVQAQNEAGLWSGAAIWTFKISPPWWATWLFRAILGILTASLLLLVYRLRLRDIRRKIMEKEKIRELESAALRAQMNPHFIFNCLQAIQTFILQNDKSAAAIYLARFAKLVRLSLHSSVNGRHTLEEEIAMLNHYLELEKLRFQGRFKYSIRVHGELATESIYLSPLLIQPFVENALVHGLQKKENQGVLEVDIFKKQETLEVSITDNGPGFSTNPTEGKKLGTHQSVGMILTQKRLDLIAGKGQNIKIEQLLDSNNEVSGVRVQIQIPIKIE